MVFFLLLFLLLHAVSLWYIQWRNRSNKWKKNPTTKNQCILLSCGKCNGIFFFFCCCAVGHFTNPHTQSAAPEREKKREAYHTQKLLAANWLILHCTSLTGFSCECKRARAPLQPAPSKRDSSSYLLVVCIWFFFIRRKMPMYLRNLFFFFFSLLFTPHRKMYNEKLMNHWQEWNRL